MQGLIPIIGGLVGFFLVVFAAGALIPVALAYVALRVRDSRSPEPDPSLGAKTAYHLINSLGILMILGGLTVSAIDLVQGEIAPKNVAPAFPGRPAAAQGVEKGFNSAQRTAVGLVGVGLIFALLFWGLLLTTNERKFRSVKRVFVGGRLSLALLITLASAAALAVVNLQKDPDHQITEPLLAILVVWLGAAIVHFILFQDAARERKTKRPPGESEEAWTPNG